MSEDCWGGGEGVQGGRDKRRLYIVNPKDRKVFELSEKFVGCLFQKAVRHQKATQTRPDTRSLYATTVGQEPPFPFLAWDNFLSVNDLRP